MSKDYSLLNQPSREELLNAIAHSPQTVIDRLNSDVGFCIFFDENEFWSLFDDWVNTVEEEKLFHYREITRLERLNAVSMIKKAESSSVDQSEKFSTLLQMIHNGFYYPIDALMTELYMSVDHDDLLPPNQLQLLFQALLKQCKNYGAPGLLLLANCWCMLGRYYYQKSHLTEEAKHCFTQAKKYKDSAEADYKQHYSNESSITMLTFKVINTPADKKHVEECFSNVESRIPNIT